MDIMYQIIAGIFSGIVAGMGMGGGTFLIPVLTIFFAVNQHIAQGINLVAFVLTASFALCVHFYKKLVVWKVALPIIASGVIFSIAGSTLSNRLNAGSLRVLFGVFLLLVGVYQVVSAIITIVKNRNKDSDIKVNKSINWRFLLPKCLNKFETIYILCYTLLLNNKRVCYNNMVDKNACIGCGACVGICPVGAISMVNGKAHIDYDICIRCKACESLCPVEAIKIKND